MPGVRCDSGRYDRAILPGKQVYSLNFVHSSRQTDVLKRRILSTAFLYFYGLHRVYVAIDCTDRFFGYSFL